MSPERFGTAVPAGGRGMDIHASCVLFGRTAVLIRGAPGSGKSSLALELLARDGAHRAVRLVGDDRVLLRACHGRLVAFAPDATRGLIEIRGVGIVPARSEARARVGLVVDLVAPAATERLPEAADGRVVLLEIELARLALPVGSTLAAERVMAAMQSVERSGVLPALPGSEAGPIGA